MGGGERNLGELPPPARRRTNSALLKRGERLPGERRVGLCECEPRAGRWTEECEYLQGLNGGWNKHKYTQLERSSSGLQIQARVNRLSGKSCKFVEFASGFLLHKNRKTFKCCFKSSSLKSWALIETHLQEDRFALSGLLQGNKKVFAGKSVQISRNENILSHYSNLCICRTFSVYHHHHPFLGYSE